MIGPLLRSPKRRPRQAPLLPGRRRRLKNAVTDALEYVVAPFGFWGRKRLAVETVEVRVRGLAPPFDGYRIAFLADLHFSPIVPKWWLERVTETAVGLKPDLIALGGDFVSNDRRYAPGVAEILGPLAAPDGVFAVLGNHDHYVGADLVRAALTVAGVRELRNSSAVIDRAGAELAVAGVGDLQYDAIDFGAALAGLKGHVPRVVLSHDPDVFVYWPAEHRLDLMLSGHTHGGQAHLPLLGPPYVPSQFGFRFLAGLHQGPHGQLYVSRGVGAIALPVRWRCPPEVTLLVLRREQAPPS